MWQWAAFLKQQVEPHRTPVLLNLDETNVRLHQEGGKGHLSLRAQKLRRRPQSLCRSVPRNVTRASLTHVAIICDDMRIQRDLPQVLLVGEQQVSAKVHSELQRSLPANVHVWRCKNAWVNATVMVQVIKLMDRCLRAHRSTRRFILSMDVYKAHIAPTVLQALGRYDFWPLLIPAKLTWALQPCDTHMFAQYKDKLTKEHQLRLTETENGQTSWPLLTQSVVCVVRTVLEERPWQQAFADTGLTHNAQRVSARVLAKLELCAAPLLPAAQIPSLAQLQAVFPAGSIIPVGGLFSALARREREATSSVPRPAPAPPLLPLPPPQPWFGRTRSTSALVAAPARVPSAPCPPAPASPPPLPAASSPPQTLPASVPFLPAAKRMRRPRSATHLPETLSLEDKAP